MTLDFKDPDYGLNLGKQVLFYQGTDREMGVLTIYRI